MQSYNGRTGNKINESEVSKMKIDRAKLELIMAKKGLNQKMLSEVSGISRQSLSYTMNGRNCRPELLGKLSKALGVEPEDIVE
jgi:hypothetical protein